MYSTKQTLSRFNRTPSVHKVEIKPTPRRQSPYNRKTIENEVEEKKSKPKKTLPPSFSDSLILIKKNINSFSEFEITSDIKHLILKQNEIETFRGFPSLSNLETLDLSENPLKSFLHFPILPHLHTINISNTPLALNPHYKIAILILIGNSIRIINNERITASDRAIAKTYPTEVINLLRSGWDIKFPAPKKEDLTIIITELSKNQKKNQKNNEIKNNTISIKKQTLIINEILEKQEIEIKKLSNQLKKK